MLFNSKLTTTSEHFEEHLNKRKKARRKGCKPGEVFENGVCMQKIGYHNRHHRSHYMPTLIHRRPIVYTQPFYTHQNITPPPVIRVQTEAVPNNNSNNYKIYILLSILLVALITILILLNKN